MNKIISSKKVLVFAHRGASAHALENTLKAFRLAQHLGADGVELDIHLSKDNHLIVMHDESVRRTTDGVGLIKKLTLDQIKKLKTKDGQKVPTLEEALDVLDKSILLNIEIKKYFLSKRITKEVLKTIDKYKLYDRAILTSFSPFTLRNLNKQDKKIKTGLGLLPYIRLSWLVYLAPNISAVSVHQSGVSDRFVRKMHKKKIKVFAWTVNEGRIIAKMIDRNINGIISNKPDLAKKEAS